MPASGSNTETPVMSEGSRSGVNWMRRNPAMSSSCNSSTMHSASALAIVVFPEPGKSSSRTCPSASRATMIRSMTSSRPFTTCVRRCWIL